MCRRFVFPRLDSAATCVVAHVRHAKPAKARCFLFNHFPAHRLPCMCLCLRTCVCPMRLLACVCVPRLLIRALDDDLMCRVSFTPVRARDTVKLIEPKHSFACGFPPKKTRPKNQVINMLHVKACCCCQWVVGFFFNFIVQQRGNSSREQNPLSSPACVSICAVCVCVVYA